MSEENTTYLATLVNGLTYYLGDERFDQGTPRIIDKTLAGKLSKVMDDINVNGTKIRRKKFVIELLSETEAKQIVDEFGDVDKDEEAEIQVLEAIQTEVAEGEVVVEAVSDAELAEAKKAITKKGKPATEPKE